MIDRVKVTLVSGKGGDGKVAFLHEKGKNLGGPAGGNGGRGGSVYLKANKSLATLVGYRFGKTIKAPDGENGHEKNMYGKDAPDVVLDVPVGTVVKEASTGALLADLSEDGETYLACVGGRGGKGNHCFANSVRKSPKFAETGLPGETKSFYLELRLLADVGLVGLPNAGKSTLLGKVTHAHPKIADYPFTTLDPQLGVVDLGNDQSFVMADLPGLIEGAHLGKGLGLSFLRHIERCRVIIHVVDITSPTAYEDFLGINQELKDYSLGLLKRPMLVALNKIDLLENDEPIKAFEAKLKGKYPCFPVSDLVGTGLKPLLRKAYETLKTTPLFPLSETYRQGETKVYTLKKEDIVAMPFTVRKVEPFVYEISGTRLVNEFRRLSMDGGDHMAEMLALLEKTGVDDRLKALKVEDGSTIRIGGIEFNYTR